MSKKWFLLLLAFIIPTLLIAGCTDGKQIKETVQQALTKQNEMKSYQFEGSTDLKLGDALLSSKNPLTAGLLSLLKESKIEWNGAANTQTVQFEADLSVTPKGAASGITIPVLIKDNKLYFNMPAISKPNEYFIVNLEQINKNSKNPISVDSLKNTTQVSTALANLLLGGIDPKWFVQDKNPTKLKDGTAAKSITVEITKKNDKEISTYLQSKLPEFLEILKTNSLLSAEQADKIKSDKQIVQIHAPGKLQIAIDDQGFIRDQLFDLGFTFKAPDGNDTNNQITIHQSFNQVNQAPTFKKEVPKQIKSFDEILGLLNKTKK